MAKQVDLEVGGQAVALTGRGGRIADNALELDVVDPRTNPSGGAGGPSVTLVSVWTGTGLAAHLGSNAEPGGDQPADRHRDEHRGHPAKAVDPPEGG